MVAVIFEVYPANGKEEIYFELASGLKNELSKAEGFLSVERFQSLANPGKFLSLSFWKDEKSVAQWRNTDKHREVQQQGRDAIFDQYRLRVATVIRDYGKTDRIQTPGDSKIFHDKIKQS